MEANKNKEEAFPKTFFPSLSSVFLLVLHTTDILLWFFYRNIGKWVKVCFPEAAVTVLEFCLFICFSGWFCPVSLNKTNSTSDMKCIYKYFYVLNEELEWKSYFCHIK